MVRALRASSDRTVSGWRLLTPLLTLALLSTSTAVEPPTVDAGGGPGWGAVRKQQFRAEATMLRADRQIKRLQKQRQHRAKRFARSKRKLDRAISRRDRGRERASRVADRKAFVRVVLGRTLRVRPNPSGRQVADKPALRKKLRKLAARERRIERKVRIQARKVDRARSRKQRSARKVGRARIDARRAARERAEDKLGARISQLVDRAQQRAASGPAATRKRGFRKPTRGVISQRYGCTGYRTNKRRGSCRGFHDGIDIAARRGAKVRASANGYVAYVGRNPWDKGKRAFMVIIGHARGYETIYAHLKPVRKVKAGQRVRRGQVIGVVGLTGHTTGPHVHWEVSKGFRTRDPLRAR